ncbi:unnamed protein product [Mytilus edulis]|uniref:B box-type domain-containing protein n=1 Tax=Mytilus edulis TaxID=6550 RepID=A0A8S3TFM8_MYTED|nr:unnamed protein product [Mytilus edulis]
MDKSTCEPCSRLGKTCLALQWCMSCQDLLCSECCNYHKALTATKDHILITSVKYKALLPYMPSTKCTNHSEKDLEYFCSEHDCSCCILCKRNEHIGCQRIEKIEENVAEISLQDEFINLKMKTKRDIKVLNILSSSTDENLSKLNEDKESLYEQMKTTRQEVLKALEVFETNIKSDIEGQFYKESEELRKRKDTYLQKLSDLENFQHMLHTIVDINMKCNTSLFLLYEKSKQQIKQDQSVVENFISSYKNIVTECEVGSEIDIETLCVRMVKKISFQKNESPILNLHSPDCEEEESETNASSTVEEEEILSGNDSNNVNKDNTVSLPTTEKVKRQSKCNLMYKSKFALNPIDTKSSSFRLINVLSKNIVVVGGSSEKRLIFYNRNGTKEGEHCLQYPPNSIASNGSMLAVSAYKAVVLIDGKTFEFIDLIYMGDNCFGIAWIKNKLIVNCEKKGLKLMDQYGVFSKTFKEIIGNVQLCLVGDEFVAVAGRELHTVLYLNIKTSAVKSVPLPGYSLMKFLTPFSKDSVILIICGENKIYKINFVVEECELCDTSDTLQKPMGLDFDKTSNEIFLINSNGRFVNVYTEKVVACCRSTFTLETLEDAAQDLTSFLFKKVLNKCCSINTIFLIRFWFGIAGSAAVTAVYSSECEAKNTTGITLYIADTCGAKGNLSDVASDLTIDIDPAPIQWIFKILMMTMFVFLMVQTSYSCRNCCNCCKACFVLCLEEGTNAKRFRFCLVIIYKFIVILADIFVICVILIVWIHKGVNDAVTFLLFIWDPSRLVLAVYQIYSLTKKGINTKALSDEIDCDVALSGEIDKTGVNS